MCMFSFVEYDMIMEMLVLFVINQKIIRECVWLIFITAMSFFQFLLVYWTVQISSTKNMKASENCGAETKD